MVVYMNIECGNIHLTVAEMVQEAMEMYDWDDETNGLPITEYYKVIEL